VPAEAPVEDAESPPCAAEPPLELAPEAALLALEPRALAAQIRTDPGKLGSATVGSPTRGALWGGVKLGKSEGIEPIGNTWGTIGTVRSLERGVRQVRRCFADTPPLYVGDISRKGGGSLPPHKSHQSGVDADVGYYYLTGPAWFVVATADNLDRPRTWALVRALVEAGNVEYVFMDSKVQALLREHARELGDPRDELFAGDDDEEAIIRHARGHTTHFHVRFRDAAALETAQRVLPFLPQYHALLERKGAAKKKAAPKKSAVAKNKAVRTKPRPANRRR
jgi:penicillin-insensitive murein endopeptidase